MADVKITVRKNGSYRVEGPVDLYYDDEKIDVPLSPFSLVALRCIQQEAVLRRHAFTNRFHAAAEQVPRARTKVAGRGGADDEYCSIPPAVTAYPSRAPRTPARVRACSLAGRYRLAAMYIATRVISEGR